MSLERLSRQEFLADYWDYRRGQHVALLEPTGGGKTRLMYQLLRRAMEQNPGLDARVTIPKRRDPGAAAWNAALGLRETPVWPPAPRLGAKPAGWALWPRHLVGQAGDDPEKILDASQEGIARQLKICAQDAYQKGDCIYCADDIYAQAVTHKMNKFFNEIWTMGGVMGCGLWGSNQKPTGTREGSVSSFFLNSGKHLFLGYDPVQDNRDRFGEIGGVDPKYVSMVVQGLQVHQFGSDAISDKLYITKAQPGPYGPAMCIVGP